jgi:hypothetical protein
MTSDDHFDIKFDGIDGYAGGLRKIDGYPNWDFAGGAFWCAAFFATREPTSPYDVVKITVISLQVNC